MCSLHTRCIFLPVFLTLCISPSSSPFSLHACHSSQPSFSLSTYELAPAQPTNPPPLPISLPLPPLASVFSAHPYSSPSPLICTFILFSFLFYFSPNCNPFLSSSPLPSTPTLHPPWRPLNGQLRGKVLRLQDFSPKGLICRVSARR